MRPDEITLENFTADLASSSPAPGGGGTSALAGSLGAALACMVANLTVGKKKYAEYERDLSRIIDDSQKLRGELLSCIEEDEACFIPLSRAYSIPKDDPARDEVMENALCVACTAPMRILRLSAKAVELLAELVQKGSSLMQSDVGVGVQCCRAALLGGRLNILINVNMMKDRQYAEKLREEADRIVTGSVSAADEIYREVIKAIG